MLNSLKNIFKQTENETQENNSKKQLNLLCGLMLEAAQVDGKIDLIEIDSLDPFYEKEKHPVNFSHSWKYKIAAQPLIGWAHLIILKN